MYISRALEEIRPKGKVTCKTFHGKEVVSKKNRLTKNGFYALPDEHWVLINEKQAKRILIDSFCYHLEDNEKILEECFVTPSINELMSSFSLETKFFTTFHSDSFECISNSFLDIAVIMENSDGVIGFVCVEDIEQS